jgi:hypothetical protein
LLIIGKTRKCQELENKRKNMETPDNKNKKLVFFPDEKQ